MAVHGLHAQHIYDAIVDDDAFAELPGALARAFGSRSCVLHWRGTGGCADILSHSGYFSDAQMAIYAENFAEHDLWTQGATSQSRVNRAWDVEQFVPPAEYERSVFHNEWIRQMGDDTFHCMGSVMQTRWGLGIIGLHRGRSQSRYASETVAALNQQLLHLRRMLGFRGRLRDATRRVEQLTGSLDALGDALFLLSPAGVLLFANRAGEEMLTRADALLIRNRRLHARAAGSNQRLQAALARAGHPACPEASALALPRPDGTELRASLVGIVAGGVHQILMQIAPEPGAGGSTEQQLQALFGLTQAEADVALRFARGEAVTNIAEERQTSVATVRTQMKAVMRKLGCSRQAELVQLIASLPRLRPQPPG